MWKHPSGHPVVRWAIRHAAWLWELFQPGEDGFNGYYRQYQRNYQSAFLPFPEIVLWRNPRPHMLKLRSKWGYGVRLGRSVASDSHVIGTRAGCFMVRSVRRMPPSSRHQRGTPARLAHGGTAEAPRVVAEPPPPLVETRAGSPQDAGAVPPTRVAEATPYTRETTPSGAAAAQPTPDEPTNQATTSSSAIVSSGGDHPKRPADPSSRERFRCLKSRDQEDAQSHVYCRCPALWSIRKDAQVAREMDTTTTHNVNVELPREQPSHLTWEVPFKPEVTLPEEQQAHLKWEVPLKMSVEAPLRHLTWEL